MGPLMLMFLCKFKYAWLNIHVPSSLYSFFLPLVTVVTLCLTSQCYELWVIPSGEVCRNSDLRKMFIKGSKCLRESPQGLDDLTVGEPETLTQPQSL